MPNTDMPTRIQPDRRNRSWARPVSRHGVDPGRDVPHGSDKHYPEERPAHRVTVDGFWIDRVPVTNERFGTFVEHTRHVTFAEIPPKAEDYPGALPDKLFAGSLVFVKPAGRVNTRDITHWWHWMQGAHWRHPTDRAADSTGSSTIRLSM